MTDMIEKTEITEKAYLAEKRLGIAEFRNNRLAVSGLLLIVVLCILSLFAPEIAPPHDPPLSRGLTAGFFPPLPRNILSEQMSLGAAFFQGSSTARESHLA